MSQTIALVFDFDDTLAPDSTSAFLAQAGVDVPRFWNQDVQALIDQDWDPVPAYLYKMIEVSQGSEKPFTRENFRQFARSIRFHEGVTRLFANLKEELVSIAPNVVLEYYLISSGIGDILRESKIAKNFTAIWASDFHYDHNGGICFPKKIVSYTDKTRYLFQIAKGLYGPASFGKPFEVNRLVPRLRIPMEQMIFVGDGLTDVPCFSLVKRSGGIAIGVYNPDHHDKLGRAWGFVDEGRVSNLHAARYGTDTDLYRSLSMALSRIASKLG